mmetsp:Transcript_37062/g.97594  ORF Transcript_37062/g.97594 Transcript_37062/m.97594 type:complete len:285 (+) Transcript_37062:755-1609(+)
MNSVPKGLNHGASLKRLPAREHDVQHDTGAKHITLCPPALLHQHLWSSVPRRAARRCHCLLIRHPATQAKVCQDGTTVLPEHDILDLHIAVKDATLVDVGQSSKYAQHDGLRVMLLHAAPDPQGAVEVGATAKLCGEAPARRNQGGLGAFLRNFVAAQPEDAVEAKDVWVPLHRGEEVGFALKGRRHGDVRGLIRSGVLLEDLGRNLPLPKLPIHASATAVVAAGSVVSKLVGPPYLRSQALTQWHVLDYPKGLCKVCADSPARAHGLGGQHRGSTLQSQMRTS